MRVQRSAMKVLLAMALLSPLALAGCTKKTPRPRVWAGDVQGRVLLDSQPMPSGAVTFLPEGDSDDGRPGVARINPDGSFSIGNANDKEPKGLPPGEYRVTVLRMSPGGVGRGPIATLASPAEYADYRTTPLRAVVRAGENRFEFAIDSKDAPAAKLAGRK
jgi:hypothetical protein